MCNNHQANFLCVKDMNNQLQLFILQLSLQNNLNYFKTNRKFSLSNSTLRVLSKCKECVCVCVCVCTCVCVCEELIISYGSIDPRKEKASIMSKETIKISINNK